MKVALVLPLVLLFCVAYSAQELPSNFKYKRETGQTTGVPMFDLTTDSDSVAYDAINGNGFEALLADIQPERGKYGLLFMNAKPRRSLLFGASKSCVLKIGGEAAAVKTLSSLPARRLSLLFIESIILQVDLPIWQKLVSANDVFIKCGNVSYNLDQDNIDAFHWFGKEVERDLERRKAKPQ